MKSIPASTAKAQLLGLLDDVEQGETVVITRHGKPIARLVPEKTARQEEIEQARADIEALRRETKPVTREEILAWRNEGRK
jgi:prevent-host-death family protein